MLGKTEKLITLVLILITSSNSNASCSPQITTEVLAALRRYFPCGDVIQLVSSMSGERKASQISKHLSRVPVPNSILSTQTIRRAVSEFGNSSNYIVVVQNDLPFFIANHFTYTYRKSSSRRPKWVFFPEENDTIDQLFEGTDLPFDSEVLVANLGNAEEVTLTEVFRIAANLPLKASHFGSWTRNGGLKAPVLGLFNRRNSLEGLPIRSSNVHDPPLSTLSSGKDEPIFLGGFSGKVWNILEKQMDFRSIHRVASAVTGNPWEDMIEAVVVGEADVCSSYMAQTTPREIKTDFSVPIAMIPFYVFIARPEGLHGKWESLVNPFSYRLWFTLLLATLLFTLIFYLSGRFVEGTTRTTLTDALFLTFSVILCHQGRDCNLGYMGCRMTYVIMYGLGLLVSASYGAALLSNLAVLRTSLPFQSMTEINAQSVFQLGTTNKSIVHMRFMNSKGGVLKKLAEKYFSNPDNTPTTHLEGFERACSMPFAFISLSESLSIVRDDLNCTVIALPYHFMKLSAGLAFPVGSPYRGLFNHNLLRLIAGGVLRDLHRAVLNEPTPTPPADAVAIDIDTVLPVLAVLIFGAAIAVVQLLMSRVVYALKQWKGARKGVLLRGRF